MKSIIAYFAKKSHNVRVQAVLALLYGMLSLFGVGGTIAIIIKLNKQTKLERQRKAAARAR